MSPIRYLVVVACASCSTAESHPLEFSQPASTPQPNGSVRVSAGSRPYVVTRTIALDAATPVVRAPARIAFRDGAISQIQMPVQGRVTAVHVKTGERVNAGDPLLTVSSPDAAAARASAATAAADHDAAAAELARQDSMATAGVGVESERLVARSRLRQTEVELSRARTTAALLGAGGGSDVVLRSPIDATVIARRATVGSIAQPGGEPLIELGNPSALWVVADVFERDLAQIHEGADVDVELSTRATPVRGHVVSIGSALTGSLRTAPVYISFEDDAPGARAGMFARAAIKAPAGRSIVLPAESVLIKNGTSYVVYVRTGDDLFTGRKVEVGPSVDGKVQVLAGLAVGEDVVVEGALLLDGAADQLL